MPANQLAYLQDLSAAVKKAVDEGKSYADAQKEIKLPKYESLGGLQPVLADEHRAVLRLPQSRDLTVEPSAGEGHGHGRGLKLGGGFPVAAVWA